MTHSRSIARSTHRSRGRATLWALAAGLLLAFATGCYPHWGSLSYHRAQWGDDDLPEGDVGSPPVLRLGGLPFDYGPFWMRLADPDDLGQHDFVTLSRPPLRFGEKSGGIVYTRRGGFLDIAHLRNASDLTAYANERILEALRSGREEIVLVSSEPSLYRQGFALPDSWSSLAPNERASLEQELAVQLAERLGFFMTSWHEVLTHYGYRSSWVVPEHQSSFVWDDQPSHIVGALVGGEAIRRGGPFEETVSAVLDEWMVELEAVSSDETRAAMRRLEGAWWGDGPPRKLVHLGIGEAPMVPPLLPEDDAERAAAWRLPNLQDVHGRDLSGCCPLRIDPRTRVARRLYEDLGSEPRLIEPDRDFPALEVALVGEAGSPSLAAGVGGSAIGGAGTDSFRTSPSTAAQSRSPASESDPSEGATGQGAPNRSTADQRSPGR